MELFLKTQRSEELNPDVKKKMSGDIDFTGANKTENCKAILSSAAQIFPKIDDSSEEYSLS